MNIKDLLLYFCKNHNVYYKTLQKRSRKMEICYMRHAFTALARSQGYTYKEIAYILKRDHTTVMNSEEKHLELLTDRYYRRCIKVAAF